MNREPVVIAEAIRLVIANAIAMLAGFGIVQWTEDQSIFVMAFVNSMIGLTLAFFVRSRVSPV